MKSPWADEVEPLSSSTYTPDSSNPEDTSIGDKKEVVAVKVMHPSAKKQFTHDLQVFRWLCRLALPGWHTILDEFQKQVMTEFDFRREARSLETVRTNLKSTKIYDSRAYIPKPVHSLSTRNVLVMELIQGKKLTDAILDDLTSIFGGNGNKAKEILEQKRRGKAHDAFRKLDISCTNNHMPIPFFLCNLGWCIHGSELVIGKDKAEKLEQANQSTKKHPLDGFDMITRLRLLGLYRKTRKILLKSSKVGRLSIGPKSPLELG